MVFGNARARATDEEDPIPLLLRRDALKTRLVARNGSITGVTYPRMVG